MRQIFSRVLQNKSRQHILAGIAVFIALIVAGQYGYEIYSQYSEKLDNTLQTKRLHYEKLHRLVANSQVYARLNESLKNFRKELINTRFVHGGTKHLSKARFQNIVQEVARKSNLNIRMTRMLEEDQDGSLALLQIEINARGEIGAIQSFMVDLRQNPHFLFIREMEIKRINSKEERYFYFNAQVIGLRKTS